MLQDVKTTGSGHKLRDGMERRLDTKLMEITSSPFVAVQVV